MLQSECRNLQAVGRLYEARLKINNFVAYSNIAKFLKNEKRENDKEGSKLFNS